MPGLKRVRAWRWTVAALIALVGMAVAVEDLRHSAADEQRQRAQGHDLFVGAIQHVLQHLYQDMDLMASLGAEPSTQNQVADLLLLKREQLQAVHYLASITPTDHGPAVGVMLDSPDLAGLDPLTLPAIREALDKGLRRPLALPSGDAMDQDVVFLVPSRPSASVRMAMLAIVDGRRSLEVAFKELPDRDEEVRLVLDGKVLGSWGHGLSPPRGPSETVSFPVGPMRMALEFQAMKTQTPLNALTRPVLADLAITVAALLLWLSTWPRRTRLATVPVEVSRPASERILAGLADGSELGLCTVEGTAMVVRSANAGLCAMLGVAAADAVGLTLAELLGQPLRDLKGDVRVNRPGARAAWVRLLVLGREGGRALVLVEDVSSRREMEASASHQSRLGLLAGLSRSLFHELGQPLNIMRLAAEGAAARLRQEPQDVARLDKALHTVMDQAGRMQSIMQEVVALAREDLAPPQPISPMEEVRLALGDVMARVRAEGIRLQWRTTTSCPAVMGHPGKLRRAVAELLDNACNALASAQLSREGGELRLRVSCLHAPDGNGVLIQVSDNGQGLPGDAGDLISDPQGFNPAGRRVGLGLPLALGVVAAMGGRMAAVPLEPGTRLEIRLPASPVSPAVAALRRRGGVRHLLVVDDEPEAAGEIAAYLARQGWRVTVAEGGNAAWRAFQSDPADAVITDLRMPDGDGWTLIRQLRDHAPALPILAVTATHGEEARKAVKCGAAVVLTKPVGLEEIAEELNEVSTNITETGTGE